jgi:hypothetical protein
LLFFVFCLLSNIVFVFQDFIVEMETELERGAHDSPLDHAVEDVLPGVHERMNGLYTEMSAVRDDIKGLDENIVSWKGQLIGQLDDVLSAFSRQNNQLADVLVAVGSGLRAPAAGTGAGSPSYGPPARNSQVRAGGEASPQVDNGRNHHLSVGHTVVSTMYYEWYGQGRYEGIPCEGGIAKMEELHKSKWRKHFLQGQKKYFNRVSVLVRGVEERVKTTDMDVSQVLAEFDAIYTGECESKLGRMECWVKDNGLVGKKKPRGKSATLVQATS